MNTLAPGAVRALTPACPPLLQVVRLAALAVLTAAALVLLNHGLSVTTTLAMLAVLTVLAVVVTVPTLGRQLEAAVTHGLQRGLGQVLL